MIRQAEKKDFDELIPDTEAAVKIRMASEAYGFGLPFLRLWCDDNNGFASLLDGAATVSLPHGLTEEWAAFLSMQPEIHSIRTSAEVARCLAVQGDWRLETGAVMTPGKALHEALKVPQALSPREVYPILNACFPGSIPEFSSWYVDVSHRIRHGFCRVLGFRTDDKKTISCAMTTAECGYAPCEEKYYAEGGYSGAAIIGAVATLPEGRGQGLASDAVLTIAHQLLKERKRVFLSPKNAHAHGLYSRIGFVECGQWGSLYRAK